METFYNIVVSSIIVVVRSKWAQQQLEDMVLVQLAPREPHAIDGKHCSMNNRQRTGADGGCQV